MKPLGWLFAIWLISSGLYWIGELRTVPVVAGDSDPRNPLIFSLKSLVPGFNMIWGVPENPWKIVLMIAEGVLGLVIITLFLLAVRRRFRR